MKVSRSIPCALGREQVDIAIRDICRMINFDSSKDGIAKKTPYGLQCSSGWNGLPEWIHTAELDVRDDEVMLHLHAGDPGAILADMDRVADSIRDGLAGLFGYKTRSFPTKVFCIGWSKTGTTSLTEALRMLGLFSWHTAPWIIGSEYFKSDVSAISLDFSCMANYTAVSDLPVCALFRELDEAFPNSKFILTTRPAESWIESALSQLQNSIKQYGMMGPMARWAYGTDQIDRDLLLQRYNRHNQEVLEYFKGRSDLLILDLAEGNEWGKLCGFLGLPVPDMPFPRLNIRRVM